MSYIRGKVERVIHSRGTFHVVVVSIFEASGIGAPKSTTATGHLFGIDQVFGAVLQLEGVWVRHAKYGRQFKVRSWRPWSRNTLDVEQFFAYAVTVFVDHTLMQWVVDHFGNDTYECLADGRAESFSDDEAVKREVRAATERWRTIRAIAALADFLQAYDLGATLVELVFERFGFAAVAILSDNPYRLVEVDGVPFERADRVGVAQGIDETDPRRLQGAILWVLRDQTKQGHLFLRRGDVGALLSELVRSADIAPFPISGISSAIDALHQNDAVAIDPDVGVYLPEMFSFERESARMLSQFLTPCALQLDHESFLDAYERGFDIDLSEQQREAVVKLISNRVLVLTGAPGTGKTTLIKAFVHLFRTLKVSHSLMAPTGIAAKRLGHVTGVSASTVHRALKYDGHRWGHDADNKLAVGAVIVDEVSMVDQELVYRLLSALEPTTMLVLVGDDAQLPSVGPGNVLRELISSGAVPTIRLDHVFRQAETSDIVLAAHKIRRGESPLGLPDKDVPTEFQFVRCADEELICDRIVQLAVKLKSRDANFQVLAPKYDGVVGVDNLNARLRDALNPDQGQPTCDLLNLHVRVGDRLMVIRNDYELNIYNGDMGKLVEVHGDRLIVRIHGIGSHPDALVEISMDVAPKTLKLAYCVTVHKSQGEEFETVILPLVRSHGRMLQRNLFYTAITRARNKVWLLGESDAVYKAVANARVQQRNTVFGRLIESAR